VRKKHGPFRADTLAHSMNAAKESFVLDFVRGYRDVAVQVGRAQWRLFFETGGTNKQASAKPLNAICGVAPVQMASYQVQEQIDGWVSNRANEVVDCVRGSNLPDATKKQLDTINRRQFWFSRRAVVDIDLGARALARSIMRHCMGQHRHPDLSRISPRLNVSVATIEKPDTADFADLWAMLRLPWHGRHSPTRQSAIRPSRWRTLPRGAALRRRRRPGFDPVGAGYGQAVCRAPRPMSQRSSGWVWTLTSPR
jgi:hypothetical protein